MSIGDYVVLGVIILWLVLSVIISRRRKKKGKGPCGGDCSQCMSACCSADKQHKDDKTDFNGK